jgi:dolichol-phosphate mannosyltransferase
VPALLAKWRGGAEIVHTVRTRRQGENRLKMWATRLAYRIIQSGSMLELPVEAGDFKLLSRTAVEHLLRLRESDPYLRGLVVWLGFNQAFVPYERQARHAGKTHFPFFSRNPWKTFVLGLTSFSFVPIYTCVALAAVGLTASVVFVVVALAAFIADSSQAGRTLTIAVLLFAWSTVMAGISACGLYIVRIYKDTRGRPPFIVESAIGLPAPAERQGASTAARGIHL